MRLAAIILAIEAAVICACVLLGVVVESDATAFVGGHYRKPVMFVAVAAIALALRFELRRSRP